jgi:subtilisin family serine protease
MIDILIDSGDEVMKKHFKKGVLPVFLCALILLSVIPTAFAADKKGSSAELKHGTYAENEVIVMFRSDAVKNSKTTLKAARKLTNVDSSYGNSLKAVGEASEAAKNAKSEVGIISDSLGDDFTLMDSITFTDDLTVARVSSEKYDTAAMIDRLSGNPGVESVEPNYLTKPNSYDYSLNDALNFYNYQANTPVAENKNGEKVSNRGYKQDSYLSTNAGDAWNKLTGKEKEVVVAVMDSGINAEHEDLKNMLWTNPGNIGLAGEHGYNFAVDSEDISDTIGHGTHCSGNIAAQADNGVGIAGTASKANVKLMMLSTATPEGRETEDLNSYRELGAFNYVLKAKQRGVNIVVVSNSWGSQGLSEIYDEIVNRLGEEGILCFFSAGNDSADIDYTPFTPGGGSSPYKVTIGAADINGKPAGFTNYGRSKVDLFAPGMNVLSSVAYKSYFPSIESKEKRSDTTEYYGLFNADTKIKNNSATPSVYGCDETVKPFGASVFKVQTEDEEAESTATCELSLADKNYFSKSDKPSSLKVTIHNACPEEKYFLYFPYQKNEATTGNDNTDFSACFSCDYQQGDINGLVKCGDVIVDQDGVCELVGNGSDEKKLDAGHKGLSFHVCNGTTDDNVLISSDELEENELGFGFCVSTDFTEGITSGDLCFYIDSIAVSKPDAEISENESYDIMSGTSMSCPVAAGAYATVASLYPIQEGQSPSEYALQNRARFMSSVRKTEELSDLCISGGYIDLSLIDETNPVLSGAVCDMENNAVVLSGENLNGGYTLSYQRLSGDGGKIITLPSDNMTAEFSKDGKTVTIKNATALFGTYTQFMLSDAGGIRTKISDFIVKGQKKPQPVYEEFFPGTVDNDRYYVDERYLLTDTEGESLYGYEMATGVVSKFDGTKFYNFAGTDLQEATLQYLKKNGYSNYDIRHLFTVNLNVDSQPAYTDNKLYRYITAEYTPGLEASVDETETKYYIASIDYTADKPEWTFTETKPLSELIGAYDLSSMKFIGMNGKLYVIGEESFEDNDSVVPFMASYNIKANSWKREKPMPKMLTDYICAVGNGKIYVSFGHETVTVNDDIETIFSPSVYCFDGTNWEKTTDLAYVGDNLNNQHHVTYRAKGACTAVKNGLMFLDCPVDECGNAFLFNTETKSTKPLYYTITNYKPEPSKLFSAVETKDGVYYIKQNTDGYLTRLSLYLIPADSGDYESSYSKITPADPETAKLNNNSLSLKAGKTANLTVNGGTVISWYSSNPKVASVKNGKVTALKKGTATVYANLKDGKYLTCKVKVTSSPKLSKSSVSVKKGKTVKVKIKGKASTVKNVYTNTKKAKIISAKTASTIKVKGLKKGSTTLKIKVNGVLLKLKVKVK